MSDSVVDTILSLIGVKNPVLSAFIVSLVSNAIPYMTVPYLGLVAGWGAVIDSNAERIFVAISGGLGAALGKVIVFLMGRFFRKILPKKTRENLEIFKKAFQKSVFLALFLFAALPLPDDVLYIPLGMTGYNLLLFFIAVFLGKVIITFLAVMFGNLVRSLLESSGGLTVEGIVALILLSIVVAIVILRINWIRIVEVYNEKGIIYAFYELIKQVVIAMLPSRVADFFSEKINNLRQRQG
ncbi:VTT domain-containing protein [Pyrofollis japonicus]|uniref:VTT domain-containing protein n=1 Tax=Pyrofollis japonicus TaxID=3060460 RepID=UPI00295B891F|nr:VTT domain-containing protein [Pyrofollis japonicus]BEP17131.1 VTT domain-containing protein [Pyrofollis japonicus]